MMDYLGPGAQGITNGNVASKSAVVSLLCALDAVSKKYFRV